jgi:hypothetical protein
VTRLIVSAVSFLTLALAIAPAAPAGQFFVGGGVGQSTVEISPLDIDSDIDFKGDDTGYKLFGGYALSKFVTFELAAFDLGAVSDSVFVYDISTEVYGASAAVTANLPLFKIANLYRKLGHAWWQVEGRQTNGDTLPPYKDSGTDVMWGLGLRFNLGRFGIRGEFEVFELEQADEVALVSVGLDYRFK